MEEILVLEEDLVRGQKINESSYIKTQVRSGSIDNKMNESDLDNKVLNTDLKAGQILIKDHLIDEQDYMIVSKGKEVICIKIESTDDFVSYQVGIDSIVNIYYTGKSAMATDILDDTNLETIKSNENTGYITVKLLEEIKILNIFDKYGNKVDRKKNKESNVEIDAAMIEVERGLVEKINNLKNYGKFSLSIIK